MVYSLLTKDDGNYSIPTTEYIVPLSEISPFFIITPTTSHCQLNLPILQIPPSYCRPQGTFPPATKPHLHMDLNKLQVSSTFLYLHTDRLNFYHVGLPLDFFLIFPPGLSCFPSKSQLCVQNKLCDNIVPWYNCQQESFSPPRLLRKALSFVLCCCCHCCT